jgi:hypothetical protein
MDPHVSRLPAAITEQDLIALGAPVRLVGLGPSAVHDALFMLYPSAAGPVESRAALEAWRALALRYDALRAVEPDRDAVIVDLRTGARPPLRASIDIACELLGSLQAQAPVKAFDAHLDALHQRAGGP